MPSKKAPARSTPRRTTSKKPKVTVEHIEVELVREEREVLLSMGILDDRMMAVVKAAKSIGNGVVMMKGDRADIDELAGWVASECTHEAKKKGGSRRRAQLLSDACDAIEAALRERRP